MSIFRKIFYYIVIIDVIDFLSGNMIEEYLISKGVSPQTLVMVGIIITILCFIEIFRIITPKTQLINGVPASEIVKQSKKLLEEPRQ